MRCTLFRNRDWLYHEYVELVKSTVKIANECGVTPRTIRVWLQRFGIERRSLSEAARAGRSLDLKITPKLQSLLYGELLGDGSVSWVRPGYSAVYRHTSKHLEYLEWLSGQFAQFGLMQGGHINKRITEWKTGNTSVTYAYSSRTYPALAYVRQYFYPDGKKIAPEGLCLDPVMARQWYIGDGHLAHHKDGRPYITLSTNGFDPDSIDRLDRMLISCGFKTTRPKSSPIIVISPYSTKDFLDYIGPCPIECYAYKWDYEGKLKVRE